MTFDFGTGTNGEMVVFDLVKIDNSDILKVKKIGADVCMSPEETTTVPTTTGTIRCDLSVGICVLILNDKTMGRFVQ